MAQTEEKKLRQMLVGTLCCEQYKFFIPYYQRGYRWRKFQVESLLSDLVEFTSNPKNMSKYYSLQPLVVVHKNDMWSVIDGQQRLTTIYLLAHKLMLNTPLFEIEYESRKEISKYLKNISEDSQEDNIEQHFLHQAYITISGWIDKCDTQQKILLGLALQGCTESNFWRLQFIWYDISDQCQTDNDEIDLFNRLNKGHLSLTSAELIKAGFCEEIRSQAKENAEQEEQRFFREWNEIENQFQEPAFWGFICNEKTVGKKYETRIEYLFDLLNASDANEPDRDGDANVVLGASDDAYLTYHLYEEHKIKHKNVARSGQKKWSERDEIWSFYQTLLSWFHDRQFYHLIGFLIQSGVPLSEIKAKIEQPKNKTRQDMIKALREKIHQELFDSCSDFDGFLKTLTFANSKGKLRHVLLLFNIEYLLQNTDSNQRFQFDAYQNSNWDLEHICSQTNIPGDKDRKYWTVSVLLYLLKMPLLLPGKLESGGKKKDRENIIKEIKKKIAANEASGEDQHISITPEGKKGKDDLIRKDDLIQKLLRYLENDKNTEDEFFRLYGNTRDFFKEASNNSEDDLTNLTLLDSTTNRSYGNAPFAVKRQYIVEKERAGLFIPPCTRDVFLKTFSTDVQNFFFWNPSTDGEQYFHEIVNLFTSVYHTSEELNHD